MAAPGSDEEPTAAYRDPYAILNLSRQATDEEISQSYKSLSRNFHPDKQAPSKRDAAQEVFVAFKNAHDILTDPVLRQVHDEHGAQGIRLIKQSLHSEDPDALYPTLLRLHQSGKAQAANDMLKEALQATAIQHEDSIVKVSATMEFPLTMETTSSLGGPGSSSISIPELKESKISLSVGSTSSSKWNMTVGGSTRTENGKGEASGNLAVGYQPTLGTTINADVDLTNPFKYSLGTTRTLSNRTMVTTTVRTIPNSNKLSLSVVSHRALWENNIRATWALGMGTDLSWQYGLLSFTTLFDNYPECTAKFNVGMNQYPIKVSAKHELQEGRSGSVSYSWGPAGAEWTAVVSRALSSYCTWSMGIQHVTTSGLTWLLRLQRGDIDFRVPIFITGIATPGYMYKLMYLSFISVLFDEAIGDVVSHATASINAKSTEEVKQSLDKEACHLEATKSRADAEQQVKMMMKTAGLKREREQESNGLVIHMATYFIEGKPSQSMDATIPLQFWVSHSRLSLPATPKSQLLGFYSVTSTDAPVSTGRHAWLKKAASLFKNSRHDEPPQQEVPRLKVRYEHDGNMYEITIADTEPLRLPSPNALTLGPSSRIQ